MGMSSTVKSEFCSCYLAYMFVIVCHASLLLWQPEVDHPCQVVTCLDAPQALWLGAAGAWRCRSSIGTFAWCAVVCLYQYRRPASRFSCALQKAAGSYPVALQATVRLQAG